MKATEQYFPVVLFIMLYKVVLTFEYVDGILSKKLEMKANKEQFSLMLLVFVKRDSFSLVFV